MKPRAGQRGAVHQLTGSNGPCERLFRLIFILFCHFYPASWQDGGLERKLFNPFAALFMITSRLPCSLALPPCVFPARQQAGVSLRCEPAA
ncbi:hypothetical protein F01_320086 [Burkholderia cenocepacia]|nr:hypothetical protein F01_320086 [Burkholderia cenocepacia]